MIEFSARLEPNALQKFQGKMAQLKAGLVSHSGKALQAVGEQYYEIIISRMGEHTGGMVFADVYWQPLSPVWLEEKREEGWVEEIWEATGEIKGAVKIHGVETMPDGLKIFVGLKGVSPDVMLKAVRNEFGATAVSGGIPNPGRPLFGPGGREMAFNSFEKQRMMDAFKKAVRSAVSGLGN